MKVTHVLPDLFQSSIIPYLLTGLSSSTVQLLGWSNPEQIQFQATKLVMDYSCLQGQAGNEQMVRFALSKYDTYLPEDLVSPIVIFQGKDDTLVSENRSLELVRLLKERKCDVSYTAIDDCDHNSILSKTENLINVMASLVGDADTWAVEIAKSLGVVNRCQSMPKTPIANELDASARQKSRSYNNGLR
jgi:pimeloyl-ACP methyl ester carboxylesterase